MNPVQITTSSTVTYVKVVGTGTVGADCTLILKSKFLPGIINSDDAAIEIQSGTMCRNGIEHRTSK